MVFPHHCIPSISLALFASVILFHAWIQTTHADKLDVAIARGIMRPASDVCAGYDSTTDGATSFSDVFVSSNPTSKWDSYNAKYEDDVFQTELSHTDAVNTNRSWALRIGKGGQVMSFIGEYGEAIANQGREISVWNDLVQQTVATKAGGADGFIHQSGPYMLKGYVSGMPPPFYSPKVAFECSDNQCTTVNWGQQSLGVIESSTEVNAKSRHRSDVMFYTRYSNCGGGVIEVDQFIHNFGSDSKTYFNTPWTGVRTSTLKSMMVANTNNVLKNQWPLRDWGRNPEYIKNLRDTGGFTTFAESIPTTALIRHPGICRRYDNNNLIDCTVRDSIRYIYNFVVQPGGCQTETLANTRTSPPGASRRAIRISNLGSTTSGHRNVGSHPPDGLLMRNMNTGYDLHILSVSHFSFIHKGVGKTFIMVDNSISNSFINSKFPAGDSIEFYYAPATEKAVEDNLSLTFVHGNSQTQRWNTRMRAGMPGNKRRDGTVWTTNFMNTVTAGSTYFNRKFLITGEYTDVNSQAVPLVPDTIEDVDSVGEYANVGLDDISLYYGNEEFGATVGTETCGEKTLSCTGSSAPKVGMKPLFYITCGAERVVSHDPYALNKYGSSKLWPWACGGNTDLATRPDYKMLGYFPTNGDCGDVLALSYSETFCDPGPPRDTSTTEVQSALTLTAPENYDETAICNGIVEAMENSIPNYRNTGCDVTVTSSGRRRLAELEVVTSGSVGCPKESANSCVEDFEAVASNTENYNNIIPEVTVTGVSVEVIPNFDADIRFVSNCTHIEFSDTKASEEIALCYNITDKNVTARIFDKDCVEELTSTTGGGLSVSSMDRVDGTPATSNDDLTVKIAVNATSMADNPIWSYNADTQFGKIEFCVRLDMFVASTSINFHENQFTIDVDMTNNFQLAAISTSRDEADVEDTTAEANVTLNAFQCEDSNGTVSNAVMSQGKILGLCVEMVAPATGIKLVNISNVDFVQDGGASSSPIVNGEVVGIAEASCEYKERTLCFIQAILTSEFYSQDYANMPVQVSGSVVFEFASSRRRRRRRQLDSSSLLAVVDNDNDVPAISEISPSRILSEDSSSSSSSGGFSLTINLSPPTSVEDNASSKKEESTTKNNHNAWRMSGMGLAFVTLFAIVSTATYLILAKRDQREEVKQEEEHYDVDNSTKVSSSMHLA